MSTAGAPLLRLDNLEVMYSGVILALKGVSICVADGGCTALLGPNGASKSTTLKAISGMLAVEDGAITGGTVTYGGRDVTSHSPQQMVAAGLLHVVEGRKVLRHLTVEQNLIIGAHGLASMADVRQELDRVYTAIPLLAALTARVAGYLSGGEQQLLLIGRAMMSRPRVVMVDEPSLGLAPKMVAQIFELLGSLKDGGMSLLIVEQNAQAALGLADHAYVLEGGRVVLEGSAAQLRGNQDIQEFYLGMQAGGQRRNYREIKHYRRRKRWLG